MKSTYMLCRIADKLFSGIASGRVLTIELYAHKNLKQKIASDFYVHTLPFRQENTSFFFKHSRLILSNNFASFSTATVSM